MKLTIKHSIFACYIGYVVQAIINCFAPLLYAMFNTSFNISMEKIGLIATINFSVQICVDLIATFLVDKWGYRKSTLVAHGFSVVGLVLLSVLPQVMSEKFLAIILATVVMACGGGFIEVILSPMVQSFPLENKEKRMTTLHSFFCWGECAVILLSTLYFKLFGISNWAILPCVWAIVPLINFLLFLKVPIYSSCEVSDISGGKLFSNPLFYVLGIMMISAGASEMTMSNWASIFAEIGLNVDKAVGDIIGPCLFALCMGIGRVSVGNIIRIIRLEYCMLIFAMGCAVCYFGAVFFGNAILSLCSVACTGFFVSLFWPGTYSLGANLIPKGGTKMFALFAFGGDIGCSLGAFLVGAISQKVIEGETQFFDFLCENGRNMRAGIFVGTVFPVLMIIGSVIVIIMLRKKRVKA